MEFFWNIKNYMIKIRVGLPVYDGKMTAPTQQTVKMLSSNKDFDFEVINVSGIFTHLARDISSLAVPSSGGGKTKQILPYDYYLAMDADTAFDVDNVRRLVDAGKDIIGGAYGHRAGCSEYIVAGMFDGAPGDCPKTKCLKFWESGLREVDWCGAGCLLIKKVVFETLEFPYWRNRIVVKDDFSNQTTEDIGFCMSAKEAGFKIYCDLDNRIAHIAH
jgi:hypothetical protein